MEHGENELQEGRKSIPAFISIALFMIGSFLISIILGGGASGVIALFTQETLSSMTTYFVAEVAALVSVLLVSWLLLRYVEHRPFSDLGLSWKGRGKDILYGLWVAVLLYAFGFGFSLALGVVQVTGFHVYPNELVCSFGFFLLVALYEEILVRGYILGRLLRTRLNPFLSLLISAVLFAALHLLNPNVTFLPMLNLVLAGLLLGVSYLYTRNLWFPISLHLFWNWIQGPVLGYGVSGQNFFPSLLSLYLPEQNILNGGAFGFEGSIICTVLMIVFIGGIIYMNERK